MRVAFVQTDPVFAAKEANVRQALSMMESARADLYVLPELFDSGYNFVDRKEVRSLADPFTQGQTFERLEAFARSAKCHVAYGFPEADGDVCYNSAAIVGHDGLRGVYRKIHLFDREKLFFQPGNLDFRVYDTAIGRIGLMICFDWYFPESARTLAMRGAQLLAHPSNLVLPNCPDGMRTRCLENRVYAITANRVGTEDRGGQPLTYIGQSQITSARGEILHRASPDRAEIVVVDVNLAAADDKQLNPRNHLLGDRRPEMYESSKK
jgi:predicted amidohydrolase